MKKPLIGITLDCQSDSDSNKYSKFPWYALRKNYADSVIASGGIPLFIPYQKDNIDRIADIIDGLIISGSSDDINPKFYNQEISYHNTTFNDERADFELQITKKVLEKNIPFFGICGGMQILNVALGGTLIQHIPDVISESKINHEYKPADGNAHSISIISGTKLGQIAIDAGLLDLTSWVNSTHHQAIDKLGEGIIVSAKAPDMVIEAIELSNYKFAIGVEWHPEYLLNNSLDRHIFRHFIEIAS
jgi:putative glutamine amidotransferase